MRKWAAFFLVFCLFLGVMPAAMAEFAPLYEEYMAKLAAGESVYMTLAPSLRTFSPFMADRVEAMNRILKNARIDIYVDEADGMKRTDFSLLLGGGQVAAFRLTDSGEEMTLAGDVLGDVALFSKTQESPLAALFLTSEKDELANLMLSEKDGLGLSDNLKIAAQALLPLEADGKTVKEAKRFKDIGSSAKKTTYTLAVQEANALLQAAITAIETPFVIALAKGIELMGEAVKLTRYVDKNGAEIAQIWTFTAMISGEERKCTMTWSYADTENGRKDSFQFVHTGLDGKGKKNTAANVTLSRADNENRLDIVTTYDFTVSGVKTQSGYTANLVCNTRDNVERFFGEITYEETVGEEYNAFIISPDMVTVAYENHDSALSGSINVKLLKNKGTLIDAVVALEIKEGEPMAIQEGAKRQDIHTEDLGLLREEVNGRLAENLVRCALTLNISDLTLLTQYISAEELLSIFSKAPTPIPMD
jgi:hypothetical protein